MGFVLLTQIRATSSETAVPLPAEPWKGRLASGAKGAGQRPGGPAASPKKQESPLCPVELFITAPFIPIKALVLHHRVAESSVACAGRSPDVPCVTTL